MLQHGSYSTPVVFLICDHIPRMLTFSLDITAAEVFILMGSEEAPIAGQSYSLLCTVTVQDGPISDPHIMWLDPNGCPLSSEGAITIATQSAVDGPSQARLTTYSISFSPLYTSNGGLYTCQATVTSPQQTLQETSSATHNLTVQSNDIV